jgi:malonyl-CoA O-methyltransferase
MIPISAIEGHSIWAPTYDTEPNPLIALERRAMGELVQSLRPATVIDVGCGTGRWLLYFQSGGSTVFGCDACGEMLSEAAKVSSLRGRVVLAAAEHIPFRDRMADLVLCSISLGYFNDIVRAFAEFSRTSKPGGLVAVSDIHPEALRSGWTRSFKLGKERYEMEHYRRSFDEVNRAAARAGLRAKSFRAIYFGHPEVEVFERAGRADFFAPATRVPALFIGTWEKTC